MRGGSLRSKAGLPRPALPAGAGWSGSQDAPLPTGRETVLGMQRANLRVMEPGVCNKNLNVLSWWRQRLLSDQPVSA